jgi:hypothetical protein
MLQENDYAEMAHQANMQGKILAEVNGELVLKTPLPTAAMRRAEILARLAEIDAASVRPLRAIAQGDTVQADHDRLAALDAEAASLRTELAGLTA